MANKVSNCGKNKVKQRMIRTDLIFFSFLGGHSVLRFGRCHIGLSDLLSAVDGVYEIDHRFPHLRLDANAFR